MRLNFMPFFVSPTNKACDSRKPKNKVRLEQSGKGESWLYLKIPLNGGQGVDN
jgi:hypothetical protein